MDGSNFVESCTKINKALSIFPRDFSDSLHHSMLLPRESRGLITSTAKYRIATKGNLITFTVDSQQVADVSYSHYVGWFKSL